MENKKYKYNVVKAITIDGKTYNDGEIIISEITLGNYMQSGFLKRIEEEEIQDKNIKKVERNSLFCDGQDPEVSIVVTFHNQESFVFSCLDNFRRQNFDKPYEVIAIIDASKENECDVIKTHFSNIVCEKVDYKNACKARNHGLKLARGKYVGFFDGDDVAYGNYIKKLYEALEGKPEFDFSYARFNHDDFSQEKGKLPKCNVFEWSETWAKYSTITNTPILIRKEKAPKWNEKFDIFQDAAYSLELVKNNLKGVHVREVLWKYRTHENNLWKTDATRDKKTKAINKLKKYYGIDTTEKDVTFVSLISRDVVLDEYFGQIEKMGLPKDTHWLIIVDTDQEQFVDKIKGYQKKYEGLFLSSRMFVTWESSLAHSRDFEARGMRIANFIRIIINQSVLKFGGTKFLFMVEDDTLVPKDAFKKLLPLMKDEKVVYASGVECGRGFTKHTGICWLVKDEHGEIIGRKIPSMKKLKGVVEIGGGGWYCWIGRGQSLKAWLNNSKMRCFDGKMLGPDVMMCHDLQEAGYKCLCDTRVQCSHYDERRNVWLPADVGKGYNIKFYKENGGLWKMELQETD